MGFLAYRVFGFCLKHLLHFEKSLRKQKTVKYKVSNIVSIWENLPDIFGKHW